VHPVLLRRRSDGQVEALSSDGTTVYTVRLGEMVQCQCLGFQHYQRCRHIAAATVCYAAMWTPPGRPQPAVVSLLHSDTGPEAA
jgi:hypothetical protein